MIIGSVTSFKVVVAVVLYLFLPLAALTYYFTTRKRRAMEVERTLAILAVAKWYAKAYGLDTALSFVWAVGYASVISCIGLVLLFFSSEIGLSNGEFPTVTLADVAFPRGGSRLVFAMASWGPTSRDFSISISDMRQAIYRRPCTSALAYG